MANYLSKKGHKAYTSWGPKDHFRALAVYKATGNLSRTADITGIPYPTLEAWVRKDWWKEKLLQLKNEDSAQLEDAATTIAKKSAEVINDRLTNGDHILNRDGGLIRKPVAAKDAAIIMGIAIQRRKELMDGERVVDQLGTAERLLKLVGDFTKFANAKEIKGVLARQEEKDNRNETIILDVNDEDQSNVHEAGEPEEASGSGGGSEAIASSGSSDSISGPG